MAGGAGLHEPRESLRKETVELHRAIASLIEELEAVDWYAQRIDATSDPELRAILVHNRDEEKEHACMTLEWIRRHDAFFDQQLRRYLFRSGSIVAVEGAAESAVEAAEHGRASSGNGAGAVAAEPTLGLGNLGNRGREGAR